MTAVFSPTATALIGMAGIREAVGENPLARIPWRGANHLAEVLGARREGQQQLRPPIHGAGFEEGISRTPSTYHGSTGLTGAQHVDAPSRLNNPR
jgi:hypothetical protein